MTQQTDHEAARLGPVVPGWSAPQLLPGGLLEGREVRLEPLRADQHAADLYTAFSGHDRLWDFMGYGPFVSAGAYHRWAKEAEASEDTRYLALRERASGHLAGHAAWLRMAPAAGTAEIGHICLAPPFQRSRLFTEAIWLMISHLFSLGYRRCEWKCNALNLASRRAAQRLGFSYEGTFRQAMVVKGRNRDTAWFAVTDQDMPALSEAFAAWLAPSNFDAAGHQRERLSDLTGLVRVSSDPML